MSPTAELLLGIIAVAVLVMAVVQVLAILAGLRVARRVEQLAVDLDTRVKPLIANLTAMTADAQRAAALAASQVERLDRVLGDVAGRVDQTLVAAQQFIAGPARQGMAIVTGIRAAITAVQGMREASRRRAARAVQFEEEEESLFIG